MKIFKLRNKLAVILNSGTTLHKECDEEQYQQVLKLVDNGDEDAVIDFMKPNYKKAVETRDKAIENFENFRNSDLFSVKGQSLYIESISQLSVPQDLANKIAEAEKSGNENLLQAYLNFWTLTCTNPDSRVRQNMFWFLNKYGMTITSSGLFVAYRNVYVKKEGEGLSLVEAKEIAEKFYNLKFNNDFEEETYVVVKGDFEGLEIYHINEFEDELFFMSEDNVGEIFEDDDEEFTFLGYLEDVYNSLSEEDFATTFTDGYTRTFNIKIGEPVTIDRKACDSVQENSCSRGLHVAGKDWLQDNYFGDVGLMVLVNPADVVAVP